MIGHFNSQKLFCVEEYSDSDTYALYQKIDYYSILSCNNSYFLKYILTRDILK